MSASASDLVRNAAPNFATTLSAPIVGSGDSSLTLSSVTGLPTGTGVTLVIDATNASGVSTPTLKEVVTGVVSGSQIVNLVRGQDGTTAQAHSTGANVVMWITANLWNDFQSAFLQDHEQVHGRHKSLTDTNGNAWIDQTATTNAVNHLNVGNAATGNGITLSAVGSDPNIPINITPKGTGPVNLPNNTITAANLATNALLLSHTPVSADYTNTTTTATQVSGLTSTVTIPSGGREVEIYVYLPNVSCLAANLSVNFTVWDGAVGSGTLLATIPWNSFSTGLAQLALLSTTVTPSAGSKTYSIGAAMVASGNQVTVKAANAYMEIRLR